MSVNKTVSTQLYLYRFMQILHFKSNLSSNPLQKFLTEPLMSNLSSNPLQKFLTEPLMCFAWIPIVVFDNSELRRQGRLKRHYQRLHSNQLKK